MGNDNKQASVKTTDKPNDTQNLGAKNPDVDKLQQADAAAKKVNAKTAKELADKLQVKVIYANSTGEWFTMHNRALLSENGKAENVTTFDFSKEVVTEEPRPLASIQAENQVKHELTEDDLKNNPDLATKGLKPGDVVDFIPKQPEQTQKQA